MIAKLTKHDAIVFKNVIRTLNNAVLQLGTIHITDMGMIQIGKFMTLCDELEGMVGELEALAEEVTE